MPSAQEPASLPYLYWVVPDGRMDMGCSASAGDAFDVRARLDSPLVARRPG